MKTLKGEKSTKIDVVCHLKFIVSFLFHFNWLQLQSKIRCHCSGVLIFVLTTMDPLTRVRISNKVTRWCRLLTTDGYFLITKLRWVCRTTTWLVKCLNPTCTQCTYVQVLLFYSFENNFRKHLQPISKLSSHCWYVEIGHWTKITSFVTTWVTLWITIFVRKRPKCLASPGKLWKGFSILLAR